MLFEPRGKWFYSMVIKRTPIALDKLIGLCLAGAAPIRQVKP